MKKNQSYYLKRAQINGIVCVVFGLIILTINLIQGAKWYEYLVVGTLIVAGLTFIFVSNKIKIKVQTKNKSKK